MVYLTDRRNGLSLESLETACITRYHHKIGLQQKERSKKAQTSTKSGLSMSFLNKTIEIEEIFQDQAIYIDTLDLYDREAPINPT